MKKLVSIILSLALVCSLAACGSDAPADSGDSATTPDPTTSESSGTDYTGGSYTLVASSHMAPEDIVSEYLDNFCDRVEERTCGKITFDRFYSSQIANQTESAEGLKTGTIDVSLNDWASMASVNGYAKGSVVSLGYLFNDYDHIRAFIASEDYQQMQQELIDQAGVRNLAFGASGFRQVGGKGDPLTSVEDFEGLRIRVPDIAIYVDTFNALGCATTIVANSEVYTALQTGIADSVENPLQTIWNMSWYEQLDYIVETNHIFCDQDLFMNEAKFQSLDEEAQAVILECAQEASEENIAYSESMESEHKNQLIDAGLEFVSIDTASIREIMQEQVWPSFFSSVEGGEELVNNILALG